METVKVGTRCGEIIEIEDKGRIQTIRCHFPNHHAFQLKLFKHESTVLRQGPFFANRLVKWSYPGDVEFIVEDGLE